MDMHRLARLADDILSANETPLFILLPARQLISRLLLFFAVGALLLTLSLTILAIVAIPVLLFWSYLYMLYCHIWSRYRLSRFYIVAAPVLAAALAVGLRYALYIL